MTVPITAVKLVGGLAGSIVAIHRQLPGPDALLSLGEPGVKLDDTATYPGQPLVHHTLALGRFQAVSTGVPGSEQSHGHVLT